MEILPTRAINSTVFLLLTKSTLTAVLVSKISVFDRFVGQHNNVLVQKTLNSSKLFLKTSCVDGFSNTFDNPLLSAMHCAL